VWPIPQMAFAGQQLPDPSKNPAGPGSHVTRIVGIEATIRARSRRTKSPPLQVPSEEGSFPAGIMGGLTSG